MEISELKNGQKIFDISSNMVKVYSYLCVHPTGAGKYHILIDMCEEPVRMYEKRLQEILDLNFNSFQEAKIGLANKLESIARRLREEPESV